MKKMLAIRSKYRKIEEGFLVFLLAISTLIVCYSVVMRFVFNSPPVWSEEIVCYIQVWLAFIGISYVGRNQDDFIKFDFIVHNVSDRTRIILSLIEKIILTAFTGLMAVVCIKYLATTFLTGAVSTPMKVPTFIPRIVLPLSFVLMFIHFTESLMDTMRLGREILCRGGSES